jgi:hypothetical protein
VTTLANRSVGMRCTLLAPQARACVADGRSGDAARHDASWTPRGFILLLNRRQIDLLEAETSESRAHAFNVVSASPPPICSHI